MYIAPSSAACLCLLPHNSRYARAAVAPDYSTLCSTLINYREYVSSDALQVSTTHTLRPICLHR